HHNTFLRIDQRCPRIGYGMAHVFNNYYQNIGSYAIGVHTQAQVLSENNYFGQSVKHPVEQMYASSKDVLIFDISAGWNLTGPNSNQDFDPLTSLPRKITANNNAQTSMYIIVERTLYVFSLIINITNMAPPKEMSIQINCMPHF
ncbi:MAG: hypothetical protein J6U47_01865, partial [Bacteroidales bacterium]|nr:hypothetical protein [Bacteroidales bacterium]